MGTVQITSVPASKFLPIVYYRYIIRQLLALQNTACMGNVANLLVWSGAAYMTIFIENSIFIEIQSCTYNFFYCTRF